MKKPLIKWPGGKSTEISRFEVMIPEYDRYIEPFVGGGALYFHLEPQKAVINDTSEKLMLFYSLIREGDREFHRILEMYCRTFDALRGRCLDEYAALRDLFKLYAAGTKEDVNFDPLEIHRCLAHKIIADESVFDELVLDRDAFTEQVTESVDEKMRRTAVLHNRQPMSEKDIRSNILTGFLGGYYMYFRGVFNDIAAGRLVCTKAYDAANFYFIREYCYGSMFRYNKEGEFNIPYGGNSYNLKDFHKKTERLFEPQIRHLLGRTELYCEDFESMLDKLDLTEKDFIFLDPPYDSEFSDYEGRSFGREDHQRLAAFLNKTRAMFLMVIKNTDFIHSLYADTEFRMLSFDNRYVYNVRRRNNRSAKHLIITNVPEGEVPWIRETIIEEDQ